MCIDPPHSYLESFAHKAANLRVNQQARPSFFTDVHNKIIDIVDKVLASLSSSYLEKRTKINNQVMLEHEYNQLLKKVVGSKFEDKPGKPVELKNDPQENLQSELTKSLELTVKSSNQFEIHSAPLIQALKKVKTVQPPLMQGNVNFNNYARLVYCGKSEDQAVVFIKAPTYGYKGKIQTDAIKNEELAYLISHHFKFDVVPLTKIFTMKELISKGVSSRLDPINAALSKTEFILQEAVVLAEKQVHLQGVDASPDDLKQFELAHVHKAILFNMVIGKRDGRPCNTVLDNQGRGMEVDNEYLGLQAADTWLLDAFNHTTLSHELVQQFMNYEASLLEDIFKSLESQGQTFAPAVKANMISNFNKIKKLFMEKNGAPVKVQDLIAINRSPKT
jgi:hypothetical protein